MFDLVLFSWGGNELMRGFDMCVGCLCTGEKGVGTSGKPLSYKGSRFHRVIKGCVVSYLLFYYFCTMLIGVLAHFVFCP